jgi:hypothetical protein
MSAAHVAALTELRPRLIVELYPSEFLLSFMGTDNTMQLHVLDAIRRVPAHDEKNGLFLTCLMESGPDAFALFVRGLEEDHQMELAAILKNYLDNPAQAHT